MSRQLSAQNGTVMYGIFCELEDEIDTQTGQWGMPDHHPDTWTAIIAEETGEVARAALQKNLPQMRAELLQLAAVCINAVYTLDTKGQTDDLDNG